MKKRTYKVTGACGVIYCKGDVKHIIDVRVVAHGAVIDVLGELTMIEHGRNKYGYAKRGSMIILRSPEDVTSGEWNDPMIVGFRMSECNETVS